VSPPLPELFDRRLQARALAVIFFTAVAVGALTLAFPRSQRLEEAEVIAILAVGLLAAVWLWVRSGRATPGEVHGGLVLGTLLVAIANYFSHGTAFFPLLFTWIGLYAFYFFPARIGVAYVGLIGVSYAVVLVVDTQASEFVRWMLAVGTPLGAGLLIARLLADVRGQATAAAAKETTLGASEARMRAIVDSAPDAFVTLDREGTIVMWNPAAERMFGYTAEEAVGR
jgi:PAS domain-containing protein